MKKERQLESSGCDSKTNTRNPGSFTLLNPATLQLPTSSTKPDLGLCRDAHQVLSPRDVAGTGGIRRGRVLHVRSQEGQLVFDEKKMAEGVGFFRFEVCLCVCIHACIHVHMYIYIHACTSLEITRFNFTDFLL